MAKRFTDTDKWNKKFIRNLKAPYKLLWMYICDECNHTGIWDVDIEVAKIKIGERVTEEAAIEAFGDKIMVIDNGSKWFIPSFIEFQYGQLSETNRAHSKVISSLQKFGLLNDDLTVKEQISPLITINKPLASPLQGAKDKDKEEDKDKGGVGEKPKHPFPEPEFTELWDRWCRYKKEQHKEQYKSADSKQAAISKLARISQNDIEIAKGLIEESIANGWKGFFDRPVQHHPPQKQLFSNQAPQVTHPPTRTVQDLLREREEKERLRRG